MKTKLLAFVVFGGLAIPACAGGQAAAIPSVNRDRPRSSYDPGAPVDGRPQQPSGVAAALGKINPCDRNVGWALDDAHLAVAQETLHSFLWWTLLGVTVCFLLAFAYILYLLYRLDLLLDMSSHMLAQLYNAHHVSWSRADKLTKDCNILMHRFNAQTQELWGAQKAAAQSEEQRKKKGLSAAAGKLDIKDSAEATGAQTALVWEGNAEKADGYEVADQQPPREPRNNVSEKNVSREAKRVAELEAQILTYQANAVAKDQKISNLRIQLNRAHDQVRDTLQSENGQ